MVVLQQLYLVFCLLAITSETLQFGIWRFCMKIDNKHIYTFCLNRLSYAAVYKRGLGCETVRL
jgi:hypothetical protein